MRKYKKSFNTMLISILLVVVIYIEKYRKYQPMEY